MYWFTAYLTGRRARGQRKHKNKKKLKQETKTLKERTKIC